MKKIIIKIKNKRRYLGLEPMSLLEWYKYSLLIHYIHVVILLINSSVGGG